MGSLCSVLSFIFLDNEREVVNVIEFDNVSKTYANGTEALKNVSLRIEDGEFVFIVGSSGAGKSTFLKIMMREQVPNKGTVIINGFNLNKLKKKQIPMFRRTLGIVFQDFRLIPNMTVYDNVAFAMRVIGAKEKEIRKRVPYILSLVGLSSKARQKPNQLSGGEQQRVSIARALAKNPKILLCDEPTGALDSETGVMVLKLLLKMARDYGKTIVIVTHNRNIARMADVVIHVKNGKIVSQEEQTEPVTADSIDW